MRRTIGTPFATAFISLTLAACSADVTQPHAPDNAPPRAVSAAIVRAISPGISDGMGTAWRQLTETVGLAATQIAAVCPRDGVNPCAGQVGPIDLTGWVWATDSQVVQRLSKYTPAILTNRSLVGAEYGSAVTAFFADFTATEFGGCSGSGYIFTCSFGTHASGWTATSDATGSPISATVQSGFGGVPLFRVGTDGTGGLILSTRGVFMWRADGSGGTAIVATNDSATVNSPYTGVVVANVLANDVLADGPATTGNVTLTQLTSSNAAITLNTATGAVSVASGVRVGVETLTYRICETARLSNCASASVTVTMAGNRVDANEDTGASKTGGGTALANVLANDTFAGGAAALSNVTIRTDSADAVLSLQPNGAVIVAAGASVGPHRLTYEICETGNPSNCDKAVVTVSITPYTIDAVDDAGSAPSAPGGIAVTSVLTNDRFDGAVATLTKVALALISSTSSGVTLDLTTGAVRVAPGTAAGIASLRYEMCERANTTNCDQATVTISIAPQGYVISNDRIKVNEGSSGSFTVKLLQQPAANVVVNISYLEGTMNVTPSVTSLTFTPTNWNAAQSVAFSTTKDSGKDDNAGTLQLVSAGIPTRHVVISGLDTDRKGSYPVSTIQAPYNGQTVSGLVNLWGSATDSDGSVVEGKFFIDAIRFATVPAVGGAFRPPMWNSATVANGWHTVELRVTDNGGNDGRVVIRVFVSN
jgi:hypothetical protein